LIEALNESYHLGNLGSDGRIILKYILMKWDKGRGMKCLKRGLVACGSKQSKKSSDSIKIQKTSEQLGE
jgi:hypothetical protein